MVIIGHRSSKNTSGANNCLCFSPHENVIIFSRTMFYVIGFVRGPQKDCLFLFISFPFSHSICGFLVFFSRKHKYALFLSDPGPIRVYVCQQLTDLLND